MKIRLLITCAALAAGAAGCDSGSAGTDASDDASPSVSASSAPSPYVESVNALCAELLPKVLEATGGGHPSHYPMASFEAERPKLDALAKDFDAKVAALHVGDEDKAEAEAFQDYQEGSDETQARLAAAAATKDQSKFDAAYDQINAEFDAVAATMRGLGFSPDCNAR